MTNARQHRLSEAAAAAFHSFKAELHAWPAYLETVTSSTAIELLCWYWQQVRREGKTEVNPLDHEVLTKRGRAAGQNQFRNARRLE